MTVFGPNRLPFGPHLLEDVAIGQGHADCRRLAGTSRDALIIGDEHDGVLAWHAAENAGEVGLAAADVGGLGLHACALADGVCRAGRRKHAT